jgi:hypothetical protein
MIDLPPPIDPWLPIAEVAEAAASVADAASNVWWQAGVVELGLRGAAVILRHPAYRPQAIAQTAHGRPYWR